MENMEKDYKAVSELDWYEAHGLDDADQEELEARDWLAVDRLLNSRDKDINRDRKGGRVPQAMRIDSDEDSYEN